MRVQAFDIIPDAHDRGKGQVQYTRTVWFDNNHEQSTLTKYGGTGICRLHFYVRRMPRKHQSQDYAFYLFDGVLRFHQGWGPFESDYPLWSKTRGWGCW